MKKMHIAQKTRALALVAGVIAVSLSLNCVVFAAPWSGPTAAPPGNNVDAPVNVGIGSQIKTGNLQVNAMAIVAAGNALLVPNGNVGIGTVTPGSKLDVIGNTPVPGTGTVSAVGTAVTATGGNFNDLVVGSQIIVHYGGATPFDDIRTVKTWTDSTHVVIDQPASWSAMSFNYIKYPQGISTTGALATNGTVSFLGNHEGLGGIYIPNMDMLLGGGTDGIFKFRHEDVAGKSNLLIFGNQNESLSTTNTMTINTETARVGIGTLSPSAKLHIVGVSDTDNDEDNVYMQGVSNVPGNNPSIVFRRSRGNTLSAMNPVQNGDTLAEVLARAYNNGSFSETANIRMSVDGAVGAPAKVPSRIEFHTTNASGTENLNMVIKSDGKVGMGTPNPGNHLTVYGDAEMKLQSDANPNNYSDIHFDNTLSGGREYVIGNYGPAVGFSTPNSFFIRDNAANDRLIILPNGNVGIGLTNPAKKLDVTGEIHATSDICTDAGGGKCLSTVAGGGGLWSQGSGANINDIYNSNTGNVGIGTTNPQHTLHVRSSDPAGSALEIEGTATNTAHIHFRNNDAPAQDWMMGKYDAPGSFFIADVTAGGANRLVIRPVTGNIGVGTNAPNAKLDIDMTNLTTTEGLHISRDAAASHYAYLNIENETANSVFKVHESGNVGVGTVNPSAKLQVNDGAMLFNGTIGATPVSGAGTRMMWIPGKAAFRAGKSFATEWDDANIGDYSVAMGDGSTASGLTSIALGRSNTANAMYSIAIGVSSRAIGSYGIAIGTGAEASGSYSSAMGTGATASGSSSIALGLNTIASGSNAFAMGDITVASGQDSTAMGASTLASGDGSTALGIGTSANGRSSIATGYSTTASGDFSTAMGRRIAIANTGTYSFGIGLDDTINTITQPSTMAIMGGNVGIATTNPRARLDVTGSGRFVGSGTSVLTGSIDPTASANVTGVGTLFTTQLLPGDEIIVSGQTRVVRSIASDTSLVVDRPFADNVNDASPDRLPAGFIAEIPSGNSKMALNEDGLYVKADNLTIDEGSPEINFIDTSGTGDVGWRVGGGTGNYFSIDSTTNADKEVGASPQWDMVFRYVDGANSANVGIGTNGTPLDKLQVAGDIRVGVGTTGCVKDADGTVIAGACSSDIRLKKDIVPLSNTLSTLSKLKPVSFKWRSAEYPEMGFGDSRQIGLVAQDVEKVMPELVSEDSKGFKRVNYSDLPIMMLQSIKELKAENDALKQKNDSLEMRIRTLEDLIIK